MRIGLNLLPYKPNQHGGAEVYIRNVVWALSCSEFRHNNFTLFVTPGAKGMYLPEKRNFQEVVLPGWLDWNRASRIIGEQFILPIYVRKYNIDVLFSNYVCPLFAPTAQIVNIHDMLYKRLPHTLEKVKLLYWQVMVPASIKRCKYVMTVSHSSAQDIAHYLPLSKDKLCVTVEGVNRDLLAWQTTEPELARLKFDLPDRYLLSSATFGKHKNLPTLIEAFAKVKQENPDLVLVLTGRANTSDAVRERALLKEQIAQLELTDSVLFAGYVSEEMLASLYKGATLYVIPSFYEGFGLSVIEAQYFGTPVVCSDADALIEVGGDAIISVPASSIDGFANAISRLLKDETQRLYLREAGYKNIKRYNWRQAASDLVTVCETIRK